MISWNRAARRRRRFNAKVEKAAIRCINDMARAMLGFRFDRTPNPAWRRDADYITFEQEPL